MVEVWIFAAIATNAASAARAILPIDWPPTPVFSALVMMTLRGAAAIQEIVGEYIVSFLSVSSSPQSLMSLRQIAVICVIYL